MDVNGKPSHINTTPRSGPPRVALLFDSNNAYARSLLIGIGEFRLSQQAWSVRYVELGARASVPAWLQHWDGDGLMLRGEDPRLAEAVARLPIPKVDLTPSRLLPESPWVRSDDDAITRMALQHFVERGFRHFAYLGNAQQAWARHRGERFVQCLRSAGLQCHFRLSDGDIDDGAQKTDELVAWLHALPKPLAVFASHDNLGQQLLEICHSAGLAVPEDIAVLGVDNDEVLCVLGPPPLSSIALNPRRTGWEAASLLSRMMAGETVAAEARLIPPVGVVARRSSDILAVNDARTVSALRYIREHACDGIDVSDVLRHTPLGRRSLESRFSRLLGRTPHQEILRVQLGRAKELLIGTRLPISQIAHRCGLESKNLGVVFKTHCEMSPSDYRKRYGTGGDMA